MSVRGKGPERRSAFDLRNLRRDVDRDLDAELDFHFEQTIDALIEAGWAPAEARAEAARRFGDRARYVSRLRRTDRGTVRAQAGRRFLGDTLQSLRVLVRGLRRAPAFALTAALTLALGIGANATMFGIVDRLLLRAPDHVDAPDQVKRVLVGRRWMDGDERLGDAHAWPDIQDWTSARTIQALAAWTPWGDVTIGRDQDVTRARAALAQAEFFPLLGVRPERGRFFATDEDRIGGPQVAVLGHAFWVESFGADPEAVGRTLAVGGRPFTVIGVAPPGFGGLELARVDLWLPLEKFGFEIAGNATDSRNDWWLNAVVRMADGVSVEQVETELTALHRAGRLQANPSYDPSARVVAASVIAARGPEGSTPATVSAWLVGVSLIVLLIACANVANLFLARGAQRRREIAVRLSLGVSRLRLAAQVLVESLLLASLAAVMATALAVWGGAAVRRLLLPDVDWGSGLDGRIALVTLAVTLAAGLAAGLVPALTATRVDVQDALRGAELRVSGRRGRLRTGLLVLQPALCVVLLVGSGLFVRSLRAVQGIDLGFDPRNLYAVILERTDQTAPLDRPDEPTRPLYESARERAVRLPGVQSAAAAFSMPFRDSWAAEFRVPGLDSLPDFPTGGPYLNAVSPTYFATMGLEVRRGRGLESGDRSGSMPVMVVSEYLAAQLWPGEDPLGRCAWVGKSETCTTVVGVVEDAHRQRMVEEDAEALYYLPSAQHDDDFPPRLLLVRANGDPAAVRAALRSELEGLDSRVRYAAVRAYDDILGAQARAWTLGATMFTLFGLLALLVAAVGIYSVYAFEVARRTPEIGIRSALGATRTWIVRLVLSDVGRVAGIGLALGLVGALLAAPRLAPLLYGVSPRDPLVLVGVALVLGAVALAAGAIPAWRATRVDPNVALRAE